MFDTFETRDYKRGGKKGKKKHPGRKR